VHEFRIIQDAIDHLTIEIVPTGVFARTGAAALEAQFADACGSDLRVDVVCLDRIARTPAGKFRYVESRIAPAVLEQLMQRGAQGALQNEH
jgi:hypothetical protein